MGDDGHLSRRIGRRDDGRDPAHVHRDLEAEQAHEEIACLGGPVRPHVRHRPADRHAPTYTADQAARSRQNLRPRAVTTASPRCCFGVGWSTGGSSPETSGMDDARASETRTGARLLTHGEAEARPRARVTLVLRPMRSPSGHRTRRSLPGERERADRQRAGRHGALRCMYRDSLAVAAAFHGCRSGTASDRAPPGASSSSLAGASALPSRRSQPARGRPRTMCHQPPKEDRKEAVAQGGPNRSGASNCDGRRIAIHAQGGRISADKWDENGRPER